MFSANNRRIRVGASGGRELSAKKVSPGEARARLTRRGVLTVGGLTLLAGYLLDPGKQMAATAQARDPHGAIASSQAAT